MQQQQPPPMFDASGRQPYGHLPPIGTQPSGYPQPVPYQQPGTVYYQQPGMYQPQPGMPPPGQQPVYYSAQPQAIQMQPVQPGMVQPGVPAPPGAQPAMQWMARPPAIPGCPPGLEYLTQIDQLLVHQVVEMLEMFTGWETANRYRLFNTLGQQAFYAFEEGDGCQRMCCGNLRGFTMHIVDNTNQEVMRISRPFKCTGWGCCGSCLCCQQEIQVEAPPGIPIGYVRQQCYCCNPSYLVMDASRQTILQIEGPCTFCPRCGDYDFKVKSASGGQNVGKITKQWTGFVTEAYTDADNFGIVFPQDMDVKIKATLLGALFLIDFMFFETGQSFADFLG